MVRLHVCNYHGYVPRIPEGHKESIAPALDMIGREAARFRGKHQEILVVVGPFLHNLAKRQLFAPVQTLFALHLEAHRIPVRTYSQRAIFVAENDIVIWRA